MRVVASAVCLHLVSEDIGLDASGPATVKLTDARHEVHYVPLAEVLQFMDSIDYDGRLRIHLMASRAWITGRLHFDDRKAFAKFVTDRMPSE